MKQWREAILTGFVSGAVLLSLTARNIHGDAGEEEAPSASADTGTAAVSRMWDTAAPVAEEPSEEAKWYFSPSIGRIDFEGDQSYKDGLILSLRLGYDYNERWALEGVLALAPYLEAGYKTTDWDSTYALGVVLDGLFHLTRWERLDPYFALGLGFQHFGEQPVKGDQSEIQMRGGAGVMYHFNDEWAVRADFRGMLAGFGGNPNANGIADVGVAWTWGARVPPRPIAIGVRDSDGDGLSDELEEKYGTDPFDPDTDKDGLSDGAEVLIYKTDPLNPDTDFDLLTDGDEVLIYKTDPLNPDTDGGGVWDGHEVLEDGTNPRDGRDDLVLFTLNIEFDTDKDVIRPEYFHDMDTIAKVLRRNPGSTAVIEGHADRRKKSLVDYNRSLSVRRARAVLNYLATAGNIEASRMKAVGYGFDRPKEKNDPVTGSQANRRVEVYLRGVDKVKEGFPMGLVLDDETPPAAPSPAPARDAKAEDK